MEKVILILVDGLRPDGLEQCGNPYVAEMKKKASYTMNARTVMPSVTLPCHMSLFHSVPPERHGVTTNTYTPQVRPINGLFEQISVMGGMSAMFHNWHELRDLCRPGNLKYEEYRNMILFEDSDRLLTESSITLTKEKKFDFVFLYLGETDEKGHGYGWMSNEYLECVKSAVDDIRRVVEECGDEYTVVVTADHGGHERSHGTEMETDMNIPQFWFGKKFEAGRKLENASILDIAPTVASLMNVPCAPEWEGKNLIDG